MRRSKRAALLAYLGASMPFGLRRRDKLIALFWPELDEARARNALSQALHVLRTSLGDEAIITVGDGEVGLNEAVVSCDVHIFDAALRTGRVSEAMALYEGDFLDGFFLSGAPEFDRWVEEERGRLRERASDVAWNLAEMEAGAGNVLVAQRWALRSRELHPLDETATRRLMSFLNALGDRSAALRAYDDFRQRLVAELELSPSAETEALAETIRRDAHVSTTAFVELALPMPSPLASPKSLPAYGRPAVPRLVRAVLVVGAALVLAGIWGGILSRNTTASDGRPRVVVLPFENLGRADEQYFADGITDEITSRLSEISGLVVISRESAIQYKTRRKTPREIAADLGVQYILAGRIKTGRSDGGGEVRVTSHLVRASNDAEIWSERYTAMFNPSELFRIQTEISERVAQAMNVAILEPERRRLDARPTDNSGAYEYYLRGNDYFNRSFNVADMRNAVQMYERAVALDSAFALAYARLALTHAQIYWFFFDRTPARLAAARGAVDRALALDPGHPEVQLALGYYHYWGHLSYDAALDAFRTAQKRKPNGEALEAIANVRRRQGDFRDALAAYMSVVSLDPLSTRSGMMAGQTYALLGDFDNATKYFDRVIAWTPDFAEVYWNKARMLLNLDQNTRKARAVLEAESVPDNAAVTYHLILLDLFDGKYSSALARSRSLSADAFEDQWRFVPTAQLRAEAHAMLHENTLSLAQYDSAARIAKLRVRVAPDEGNYRSALALAYAGLGKKGEAIIEGRKATEVLPVSRDAVRRLYRITDLARVYVMVGEPELALATLERLAALPGGLMVPLLAVDPVWRPLRELPRFRRLLARAGH